ncbi:MAG: hypothetical protein ACWGQW_11685 [bacterium]
MKYQVYQIQVNDPSTPIEKFDASRDAFMGELVTYNDVRFYTHVANIEANSLDEVFAISNMGTNEEAIERLSKMHSVSVGDLVVDFTGTVYQVARFGWALVENPSIVKRLLGDQKFWPNEVDSCYDCGSTIPGHHTELCDFADESDIRDLPSKDFPKQAWNGERPEWPVEHPTDAEYEEDINADE